MRSLNTVICLLLTIFLTGCEQHITDAFAFSGILEVDEENVQFGVGAYSKSMRVKGVVDWDVDSSAMDDWCSVLSAKDFNNRDYITILVDSNTLLTTRETTFDIISGGQKVPVRVSQLGNVPTILFASDSVTVGRDTNLLKINFVANIEYGIQNDADWFTVVDEDFEGAKRMLVRVCSNNTGDSRTAQVTFRQKEGEGVWIWKLTQLPSNMEYKPVGLAVLEPNKKIMPSSATASTQVDNKGIDKSYDGSHLSYYQSLFQKENDPVVLEYRFDGLSSISYINYLPYEGDQSKSFKKTEIWVQEEGEDYRLEMVQNFEKTGNQIVVFKNPIDKPVGIKFVVKTSYDVEPGLLVCACSEMEFYSSEKRYDAIFADNVYGSLNRSVNLEQIFDIEDPMFRNIASHLYHRNYEGERIARYPAYPEVKKGYMSFGGSYGNFDNVTGIFVEEGEVLPVFADGIGQSIVYLTVFNPQKTSQMRKYRIYDGVNKLTMDYQGHVYISYHSVGSEDISVHIAGGKYIGFIDAAKPLEEQKFDWEHADFVDVLGKHAHLLFSVETLEGKDLVPLVERYDRIVRSQQIFMGMEKYGKDIANRILFLETRDRLNMSYSGKNYICCPSIDMEDLTQAEKITGDKLWNLALCVGIIHNHVMMSWNGISYTTPKLFALATQEALGETLEINKGNWYSLGFKNIMIPEYKLTAVPDDYFSYSEKIVPFWQLYMYASQVLGKKDFYKDVLNNARRMPYPIESMFIGEMQKALQLDLSDYVKKWGFSSTARNRFKKAPVILHYLTPQNIGLFQKDSGAPSAMGYMVSNGTVKVLMPQNVAVYVVRHTFVPTQIFDQSVFKVEDWRASMQVYAVGADGTEVELKRFGK